MYLVHWIQATTTV